MKMSGFQPKIQNLIEKKLNDKIPGIVIATQLKGYGPQIYSAGNLNAKTRYFIASATKMYITALILKFQEQGLLNITDDINTYLPKSELNHLHVYRGQDFSNSLKIWHLMSHQSGLPDYFQARRRGKTSLINQIKNGQDQKWDYFWVIDESRKIGASFSPYSGRALYSDTNYQILGRILELVLGKSIASILQTEIFGPLELEQTYLYTDPMDSRPININFKKTPLKIPQAMSSFGPDGGIVSTVEESLKFLIGFFEGQIFSKELLPRLFNWKPIFFPLEYGIGISRLELPWFLSPFKRFPEIIGHSGLSGAFQFFCPEKELYLAGTVNQIASPEASFRLMLEVTDLF